MTDSTVVLVIVAVAFLGGAVGATAHYEAQHPTVFHQAQIDSLGRELETAQRLFNRIRGDLAQTRDICVAARRRNLTKTVTRTRIDGK